MRMVITNLDGSKKRTKNFRNMKEWERYVTEQERRQVARELKEEKKQMRLWIKKQEAEMRG